MYTVRESELFQKQVKAILTEPERLELFAFIAENPFVGDVVKHSGGCRKLRWYASGKGKRSGSRVIYFNELENGIIEMLTIYEKKNQENLLGDKLFKLKEK